MSSRRPSAKASVLIRTVLYKEIVTQLESKVTRTSPFRWRRLLNALKQGGLVSGEESYIRVSLSMSELSLFRESFGSLIEKLIMTVVVA